VTVVARASDLRFAYGNSDEAALDGVEIEVVAGEVLLLEGPSGGGKSTLLRALSGSVPHFHGGRFAGHVEVAGMDTMRSSPARVARAAGLLFQDPEAQAVLGAVDRDVAFGLESAGHPPGAIPARVREVLGAVGAEHLAGRRIAELSGGERQRVALAAVLACRPALLLLDEPTSQLDDAGAAALGTVVRDLAADGTAVLIAEHRAERVRPLADRVLAVEGGRIAAARDSLSCTHPAGERAGPARLRLEGIAAGYDGRPVIADSALDLSAGTVTAIRGPNGAGKTLLCRVAAGLHVPACGRVVVDGRDVTGLPAEHRFPALALVSQDPGRHLLTERVRDEIEYALVRIGLRAPERRRRTAAALAEFDLDPLADRHPLDLSVGERERVALAASLVARPGVIILDEPTRGMDPARKAALAAVLRERAAEGAAIMLTTHDAVFAGAAADRTVYLHDIARGA
jgi:energy-coupling factor transport system ATP-binding protein